MTVRVAVVLMAAAVAFAVGCGGDSKPDSSSQATGSTTEFKKALTPEGNRKAAQMALTVDDFPTGWRETTDKDDDDSKLKCPGYDLSRFTLVGRAAGKDFTDGDNEVNSSAGVFETAASAEAAHALMRSPNTRNCLTSGLQKQLGKSDDVEVGEVDSGEMSFPDLGDETSALRIAIPLEAEGVSVTANIDVVVIRRGAALSYLLFANSPFTNGVDADQEIELARLVDSRMNAALAQ